MFAISAGLIIAESRAYAALQVDQSRWIKSLSAKLSRRLVQILNANRGHDRYLETTTMHGMIYMSTCKHVDVTKSESGKYDIAPSQRSLRFVIIKYFFFFIFLEDHVLYFQYAGIFISL